MIVAHPTGLFDRIAAGTTTIDDAQTVTTLYELFLALRDKEELFDRFLSCQEDFQTRFPRPTTPAQMYRTEEFFNEEVEEFTANITESAVFAGPHDMCHELADLVFIGLTLCRQMGHSISEIRQAFEDVIEKNEAKTTETHYVRPTDQKVVRKP